MQERETLRTVLEEVFLPLHDHVVEKYQRLENRIYNEMPFSPVMYSICTTLLPRSSANRLSWFFPISAIDLSPSIWTGNAIQKALAKNDTVIWDTIYIEEDYLICRGMEDDRQSYPAALIIGDSRKPVRVRLRPAQRYRDKVVELYHLFQTNGIPWVTPHLPFCYKFFDIVLADNSILLDLSAELEIKLEYDIKVFSCRMLRDIIPVWNLCHLDIDQEIFPVPAMDKKNYEYRYILPDPDDGYLVCQNNLEILMARREKNDLIAISPLRNGLHWSVLQFMQRAVSETEYFEYPVYSNRQQDNFAGRLGLHYGALVRTKAELLRLLRSFEASEYMLFDSVQISAQTTRGETYDVNAFLKDELRDRENLKTMLLRFSPLDRGYYLNRDIMSFLVSQVQLVFPEYNCVGVLV